MHKVPYLLILLLLVPVLVPAQSDSVYKYWVTFADKGGSGYTLDNPADYLAPRSLERRQRQHIAIDSLDLPVSPAYIQRLQDLGFRVQNHSKWLNGVVLFAADSSQAAVLDTVPFVTSWQLFDHGTASLPQEGLVDGGTPACPIVFDSLYDSNYYRAGFPQIEQLRGRALHRAGYEGQGLVVGVCDGGFPGVDTIAVFDTLRSEGRLLATRDFVWDGDDVYSIHNHGTAVLSNLASYIPGLYVGTAPKASYVLCRTENTYTETPLEMINWVAAAEYLDSLGADVITTSLGYYVYDDTNFHYPLDGRSAPISQGAGIAVTRGMLVVNAAGNNGHYNPPYLNAPADVESVLTVGAVDGEGVVTGFSSPGPTDDGRLKPDVMAMGQGVAVAGTQGYLRYSSGTSFATPILAGMMTCLWQRFPDWTPQQLCDSVRSWGSRADSADYDYGYGIPDFSRAMSHDPAPLDIPVLPDAPSYRLYPNPTTGAFTVECSAPATLTVTDLAGRRLLRQEFQLSHLTFQLPAGVYLVTVTTATTTATQRLVVR